jgi:hypothetical protein
MRSTTKEQYIFLAKIVLYHNNRVNARIEMAGYVLPVSHLRHAASEALFEPWAANFSPICRSAK